MLASCAPACCSARSVSSLTRLEFASMIGMAGDTPSMRTPHRLRLGSSGRLSELFCCLVNAQCRCIQAIAIAFKRFLLHKSDDFCLITLMQERFQLSLKTTYVGHS